MTKILAYLSTPGGLTGAPRRLLTLCGALSRHGLTPCLATQSDSELIVAGGKKGYQTVEIDPIGVLALRHGALFGGGLLFKIRMIFDLFRQNLYFFSVVKKVSANVVWIRGSKDIAFVGVGALISRQPLVWDVDYELPSKGVVRVLHHVGLALADIVVFQYEAAAVSIFGEALADRYRHKFHTITPGISLDSVLPYANLRSQTAPSDSRAFKILQVGTICDRKNQILIIEALRHIEAKEIVSSIQVFFAGEEFDKNYANEIRRKISDYELCCSIEFLGWRDDIHALMAGADILVMPSKDEGVPNTVQEAMAIGLPVLASNAGGIPEVISNEETGWILPLDHPEIWAKAIERCIEDAALLGKVGGAARGHALKFFGTEQWGRHYADLVKQVVRS